MLLHMYIYSQFIPSSISLQCGPNYKMLKFEWKNNQLSHIYPSPHTGCIGGCDSIFLEMLRINPTSVRTAANNRTQATSNTRPNTNRAQPIPNSNSNSSINTIPVAPARQALRNTSNTNTAPPRQFVPPQPASRVPNTMNNQPRMPVPRSNDNGDNSVLCGCNKPAIILTVRKQTANHGMYCTRSSN